jgi:predicted transcriptional regulator
LRSRVFEEALVHVKLQTALLYVDGNEKTADPNENLNLDVKNEFVKADLKVIEDILTFCSEPRTKTKIMSINDLSVEHLCSWMQFLLSRGLLVECSGEFVSTKKGQLLLELFAKLRGFFGVNETSGAFL